MSAGDEGDAPRERRDPRTEPVAARDAASVVLCRGSGDEREIYLVRRSPELRFFGDAWAFPGGAVEDDDHDARACAVRETLEEVAVRLDAATLREGPRFVTPRFGTIRFDTVFYFAETAAEPRIACDELVEGRWMRPADAFAAWRRGEMLPTPPAHAILRELARRPFDEALATLRELPSEYEGSGRSMAWTAGYEIIPLTCAPLPPSMPMATVLVGWKRFIVIDPGPQADAERAHLVAAIERRVREGDRLEAVVLTHHHVDHVGALDVVLERFGAPLLAHATTGELLERRLDRALEEGDTIPLGEDPAGRGGWELRCLFTPGHAAGHIALLDERHRALVAGDLVSTAVSMYVGSPGGNLRTYLASIERLRGLDLDIIYPAHGSPSRDVARLLDRTVRHRRDRLAQIEGLLDDDGRSVTSIAQQIYRDIDPDFREFFDRAARASLEYLAEEGRAREVAPDVYARASQLPGT